MKQEAYEATAAAVASKATYGGAGGSFAGFMLSNEFVALVGLLIVLAGFLVNWHYRAAQDRRDALLRVSVAHECWLNDPIPDDPRLAAVQATGISMSLSAALLLYDNYHCCPVK